MPAFTGKRAFDDYNLEELVPYIDWQPFFIAWEMHGKFPQILSDAKVGEEATKLYNDARVLLDKITKEKWFRARGVIGFWPAATTAPDTIVIGRDGEITKLEFLRQQMKKAPGQPNLSLADFIKPASLGADDLGGFAVTIHGIEPHVKRFEEQHDDYSKIILQALATAWLKLSQNCFTNA